MPASKNRTMIDGIYTDMIIGVDTETPSQRVNVTWGDDNQNIDLSSPIPVLSIKTEKGIDSDSEAICLLGNILTELRISNKYNARMHNDIINEDDLE